LPLYLISDLVLWYYFSKQGLRHGAAWFKPRPAFNCFAKLKSWDRVPAVVSAGIFFVKIKTNLKTGARFRLQWQNLAKETTGILKEQLQFLAVFLIRCHCLHPAAPLS
jgi:hypothetical protein